MPEVSIQEAVRDRYAKAARKVDASGSCCGGAADCNSITSNLYADAETADLPDKAVLASLGCGNPTALAELLDGETVLDLGSGGGTSFSQRAASVPRARSTAWT